MNECKLPIKINLPENFLDEEIRCEYTISSKMKKAWAVQIDLLKKLETVCEKYSLKYFADSGTLIGAIRDNGYIPWDDDIDIVMFREDYDKLLEIAKDEFEEPYFLQNTYSDTKYMRGHSQLRNSLTTGSIMSDMDKPFNKGIFIDIFPLDNIPDDIKKRNTFFKTIRLMWIILSTGSLSIRNFRTIKGKIACCIIKPVISVLGYKRLFRLYENYCSKYNSTKTNAISYVAYSLGKEKHIWDSEWFKSVEQHIFEFTSICVPNGYDARLRKEYGDYLKPAHAPSSHGECIIDATIPYFDYFKTKKH